MAQSVKRKSVTAAQQLKLFMDNSEEACLLIDKDLKIIASSKLFNKLYKQYFNMKVEAGTSILNYALPERKPIVTKIYEKVFAGKTQEVKIEIPVSESEKVVFLNKYKPISNGNGKIDCAFVSCKDISAEQKSRYLLKMSEKRYRSLVENSTDGIAILNTESRVTYISPAVKKILGYSPEEVIYEELFPVLYHEDVSIKDNVLKTVLEKPGVPVSAPLVRIYHKNGELRWLGSTMTNMLENDAVQGIVVNFRDQTNEFLTEQEHQLVSKIIKALQDPSDFESALHKVLQLMAENMGFSMAEAWFVAKDKSKLYLQSFWNKKKQSPVLGDNIKFSFKKGEGLPGVCWSKKELELWDNIDQHPKFIRKNEADEAGLKQGLALPIIQDNEVIAVFTFFTDREQVQLGSTAALKRIARQIAVDVELKRSLDELNDLFKYSPGLICVAGTDNYFKKVNPAFSKLLRYTEDELLSKPFYDFLHPEDRAISIETLKGNTKGLRTVNFENRYLTKDGEVKWIAWYSSDFVDKEGNIYGFGMDVTEAKTASLELLRYKNIIEHSQSGIGILTIDDEQLYMNPLFEKMLGYSASEIQNLGGPFQLYVDQSQADEVVQTLMSGNFWNGDIQLKNKKGEILDLHMLGGGIENDKGELIAIYGIHTDISDRLQYERELENYNKNISNILNSISDGFFSLGENWKVNYWNKEAENLLGVSEEEIMGKVIWDYFPEATKLKFYTEYEKALKEKKPALFQEYFPPLKAWFEVNVYPAEEGISVFFRNVTEQKSQEKLNLLEKQVLELNTHKKLKLEEIIECLLNGIREIFPDMLCSVLRVIDGKLYNWSSPQLPKDYVEAINGVPIADGVGSCGTAAFLKEKVIVSDISSDPLWEDFKEVAAQHNLAACWSYPILDKAQNILGTFGIYYNTKRAPIRLEEDSIDRIRTILTNIIEHKWAEEAILISNERYDIVSKATNDAIWDWDIKNDRLYFNDGYEKLFGYALNNSIPIQHWIDHLHPDEAKQTLNYFQSIVNSSGQNHWDAEYRYLKSDGEYAYVYDRGIMIRNEEGIAVRMIGAMQDISKRKQDEQNLLYKSKLLEVTSEVSNALIREEDWMIALDKSFNIIGQTVKVDRVYFFENSIDKKTGKACTSQRIEWTDNSTISQINNSELQNLPFEDVIHFIEPLKNGNAFEAIVEQMPEGGAKEILRSQDIKSILVLPLFIKDHFYGFIGFDDCHKGRSWTDDERAFLKTLNSNVTTFIERKKSKEMLRKLNKKLKLRAKELAESNAELEQFAYIASHDLQEPLRMVRSFLNQIEKKYKDKLDQRGEKYIELAVDGAVRMRQIILDFLEYSRAGKKDFEREKVDMNSLMKEVVQLHQLIITEKQARVEWGEMPEIFAAKTAIQQVISNLVGNALKYSSDDEKPIIKVTACERAKEWEFAVADNGIGIEPQFANKIFVLFQRLHDRNDYDGTGIGLAICKKIIESHNGKIWFESEPGKGSVFYFTIAK
ncbi:MAG: PAS domain S-box protein [Chitinophagales bacterium]